MRTIQNVIDSLSIRILPSGGLRRLPKPDYNPVPNMEGIRLGLAVESMRRHMTDEGWQLFQGLEEAGGYQLTGYNLPVNETDVRMMLASDRPIKTLVLQDKREWDTGRGDFRDARARFTNVELLADESNIFKVTVLKDAHQRPDYHRQSADEIKCHAWIVYYHPSVVEKVAPYVRREHLIRTYHSLDPAIVPHIDYEPQREGCLLSGAVSAAYPFRQRLVQNISSLPSVKQMRHPGYHRNGCETPAYLKELATYKVAICTSSMYGYALRKIIEATAAGCIVVTDLPSDEVLPEIDGNLFRIDRDISIAELNGLLNSLCQGYDKERQQMYQNAAKTWYSYRSVGYRLAEDIETLRLNYNLTSLSGE